MKKTMGFTLIELMIAVAVAGILAAIAYPSYLNQVQKSRRADAMGELQQAAADMERHFTVNGNYDNATAGTTIPNRLPRTGTQYYNVSLTLLPAAGTPKTGFTIEATPIGSQVKDGKFLIRHTGAKQWDADNDGSYNSPKDDDWAKH